MKTLSQFLIDIQDKGLAIHTVYDIGAFKGQWTEEIRATALPDANFILFEANPEHKRWLEFVSTYYIGLLSDSKRDSIKFYSINGTGDSYYQENTVHYNEDNYKLLPCTTLDTVVFDTLLPLPNFIKIDTQGSELDILRGASKVLEHAELVYLECPIIRYNHGAPNIQDYLDFMRQQNFAPIDLLEIHCAEHTLLQVDIMFIKITTKNRLFGQNATVKM